MLHALSDRIVWGVGIDFDYRLINAANLIKKVNDQPHISFYVHNVENDPLDLILDLVPTEKVDIVFLLAVCMWIDNWKEVINFSAKISENLLFESNGTQDQQNEQADYLNNIYEKCDLLSDKSEDDRGKKSRRMYLCQM